MSRLARVSESCQQVAEAIATVLKVEVEIIDTDLVRIAGTGMVRTDVGTRLLRGLVNKHVLQTGAHIFINEAGFHEICLSCPLTGKCFYKASIVYPVTAENEVIGTVSLIAFNQAQKETLLKNTDSLIGFISRMADLISSKALEHQILTELTVMANRLEAVVDSVEEGIIAINSDGVITHFNSSAERLFGTKKENVIGRDSGSLMPALPLSSVLQDGKGFNSREIFMNYEGRKLHLLSTAKPIKVKDGRVVGVVSSLRDFKETQKLAYEIMNTHDEMIGFDDLVGISKSWTEAKAKAQKISAGNSTALIIGESGTGKEIFARAIHSAGPHGHKPFISVNCAAVPENLLEIELFGYDDGAFAGARRGGKPGKIELASGGTIFLEEVGNLSLYLQTKLLKLLQERVIERVGGARPVMVDTRVIAATNTDLQDAVRKNLFRDDLYYRLSVMPLIIPPLRERQEDIPILLDFYMKRFNKLLGKNIKGFTAEAINACMKYHWPGNVRELVYSVEYAINIEEGDLITIESLPHVLREQTRKRTRSGMAGDGRLLKLAQLEKEAIAAALEQYGWSDEGKVKAARVLGISRATIYRKIQKYGLKPV
ncbi:MAG TPA: sigma 54-interacting transcriptional regulator [Bacillota bacterium]|nr:sigma 54-interacting transcriptional regulator [Bacillota bacterium]